MPIFIHFSKLQRHVDVLLEEQRLVYSLIEELGTYERLLTSEEQASRLFARNQLHILQKEYESIQSRIDFLNKTIDSFAKLSNGTSEELRNRINQFQKEWTN